MIKLMFGDCLERMKEIPDNSVDMVLCDLPYGTTQNKWDSVIPLEPLWADYTRICKGAVVLTAADPFSSRLVLSNLPNWKQTLVWRKNCSSNFLNSNRQHLCIHENILVFGGNIYNPQKSKGLPYRQKRRGIDDTGDNYGNIKKRTDTENNGDRFPTTDLYFPRETGLHPTQKPVALMEYLIRTYTNEGHIILDSTMGSGTTGVACVNTNRSFIGIERDEDYFVIAQKRIRKAELNSF